MVVTDLRVQSWRNLEDERLPLESRVTVLFGRNGQGKTNLIEALYYAVSLRSFRTTSTTDLIKWGAVETVVQTKLVLRGLSRSLTVRLSQGRKVATLDGKGIRRDSDALIGAGVIVFGPEDLRLPKAAAAERRRALDRAVFAVQRTYFREAAAYEKALKGRNSLLRRGEHSLDLLGSYDETLAKTGARIILRRRAVASSLAPRFAEAFAGIHGEIEASIRYRSHELVEAATTEEEIATAIRRGLEERRNVDEQRRFTGFGPHTDEWEMKLGDRLAREHGSQGQLRSMMLALKFAELRYVEEENHEAPILLLDDVASELDEKRRGKLFETIRGTACQTLLTVTERNLLPDLPDRVDWRVQEGHVERVLA